MHFYSTERVAIFIDGQHLHALTKALGFDVDFKEFLKFVGGQCNLVRASYYTALPDTDENISVKPLVDWLAYNGFTVVTKIARTYTDENGHRRIKGRMDGEIIVDALEMAPRVNHILMIVGDGIYRRTIEAIQGKGVRVTVLSSIHAESAMVADELRRQADQYIDIKDIAG